MRQRSTFDTVMQTLADNVPLNVSISGFILDKKTFSLSLTGSDLSLISTSVDNFTKLMTDKKLIKSLTIQGLVTDEKNGKYVLSLSGNVL